MIGLHNMTLDELRDEADYQDNELAKIVFDQAVPEAEEAGRERGIEAVTEKLAPVGDLLEKTIDTLNDLAEYLGGAELDQLLDATTLIQSAQKHLKEAENVK